MVIIGGGMVGCETRPFSMRQKRTYHCSRNAETDGKRYVTHGQKTPHGRAGGKNHVTTLKNTTCVEITDTGIGVKTDQGEEQEILADTIVLAVGYQSNDALFKALKDRAGVYNIGDSANPQRIREGITSGYQAGLLL